jgi:outer membrane receptor protein involved in Fe transport
VENKTLGTYVQEQAGWNDRIFLTGALRVDNNSAFGANFNFVTYPKLSASWVMNEEPFWKHVPVLGTFRLRAAAGSSGSQPDVLAATRLYTPSTGPGGGPTVTPSNLGNPDLKPEVGQEVEAGFDASMLDERLALELTAYREVTRDAIIAKPALPSLGFPGSQFVNLGRISNTGVELGWQYQLLRNPRSQWEVHGKYSATKNNIDDLGGILAPVLGNGFAGQRNVKGFPVGSIFLKKVLSAQLDANNKVINAMCEGGDPISGGGPPVPCAQAGTAYWGYPTPGWDAALGSSLRYKGLTFSATAEAQGGNVKCDADIAWAHFFFRNTYAINVYKDPVLAAYDQMGTICQGGLVKAGFAKLRDLSVRYDLPTPSFGAKAASVTVAATNVVTLWVQENHKYGTKVIDPEVHGLDLNGLNAYVQDLWPQFQRLVLTMRFSY